jgi:hypothetical protein
VRREALLLSEKKSPGRDVTGNVAARLLFDRWRLLHRLPPASNDRPNGRRCMVSMDTDKETLEFLIRRIGLMHLYLTLI